MIVTTLWPYKRDGAGTLLSLMFQSEYQEQEGWDDDASADRVTLPYL